MSHSGAARTARLEPSLTALTSIRPSSISTSAWMGAPPSNIRAAPSTRLARPAMMAANCSRASSGMPADVASGTPSTDTTIACATSSTRVVKSVTSQFRSWR